MIAAYRVGARRVRAAPVHVALAAGLALLGPALLMFAPSVREET